MAEDAPEAGGTNAALPDLGPDDEASFLELFGGPAVQEADDSTSSKGPDVPSLQTDSPGKPGCQAGSPGKVQDVPNFQTSPPAKQGCKPGFSGQVQAQISQFFRIPSPKVQRSAADQLKEAQEKQQQVVSPIKVVTADGTAQLSPTPKPGGSFDRLGLPRQNPGGRPSKPVAYQRGSWAGCGGDNSRQPGEKPLRYEPGALELHRISVVLNSKIKEFPDSDEGLMKYWKQMKQLFPNMSRTKLGWVKDNEKELKKRVAELGLSHAGPGGGKKTQIVGAGRTKGCRAPRSAEKQSGSQQIIQLTKSWHEQERRMGHDVDATDILNDYIDRCEYTFRLMEQRGRSLGKDWSQEEKDWTADVKRRWETLRNGSKDTRVNFTKRLLAKMNAKIRTPSRSSPLTVQEEKIRCEETWKAFDYALWLAGCADKAELADFVADPEQFILHREDTWLLFSDQIPFWVKIGKRKIVCSEFETQSKSKRRKLAALKGNQSQKQEEAADPEDCAGFHSILSVAV